jgi:hypothetical protein
MKFATGITVALVLILSGAARAEYTTIDEIAKAYSDEACRQCHGKIHDEWKASYHSQSIVHSAGGIRNFIVVGLGKEWNKPVSREHLMRCMDCHAPQLKDASEPLIKEIAQLIVASVDEKDESGKTAAKKELAKLNVNCVVCHNTKVVSIEKNLKGAPKAGVFYGPSGKPTPAHGTEKSPALSSALFCGQCHGIHEAPDGDVIVCNTLYGSYEDAYRAGGGAETCQDCHMRKAGRGHTFPGAYQLEIVKEGIGLDAQVAGIRLHPGKWIPTAVVNVGLINRAGHRIPDG